MKISRRWRSRATGAALTAAAAALPLAASAATYTITANIAGGHASAWLDGLIQPVNALAFYLFWGITGMIAGLFAVAVIHQRGRGRTYGLAERLLDHPLFPLAPAAALVLLASGSGHLAARSAL